MINERENVIFGPEKGPRSKTLNDMGSIRQRYLTATPKDDEVIDLAALLGALWRNKTYIFLAIITSVFIGGVYAYILATPIYRSTAVVMLNNREEQQVVDLGSVMGGLGGDSTIVNTEVEVLKSRILLGKVVDELELTQDPEFNSALTEPNIVDRAKSFINRLAASNHEVSDVSDREKRSCSH